MKYKILKTEETYNAAVRRIEEVFDAKPGSAAFDELELLSLLVKDYEDRYYPGHGTFACSIS
ncbi:antitoxin component HigA of HigAB toxin-antitoxin module [Pedobacter africanus]|uniref:Antitoxin component HigA of HigAB toxin-antitoxin module n=1 Tax=Pedobacter africanus TaxID=151894 RepID=A0ACC6L1S8_9SPHI|nr:antitoxin component HigA of HigAB toxin-antitoxin module [Pedobacter africanus]